MSDDAPSLSDLTAATCIRCGYDLRGLAPDGRCPECGLPIARSAVPGDELRHAPPHWLASLSWGARLVLAVPVLAFFVSRPLFPRLLSVSLEAGFALHAAFGLAFAAGVWLLTRPQRRFGPRHAALLWALRLVSLVPLAETAVIYCIIAGSLRARYGLPGVVMLGFLPLPALLFLHLRGLARRVLDPRLAEHCVIVGTGATLSFAVLASGLFVRLPITAELVAGVGAMLFVFWGLFLMLRFAIAFARARRESIAVWGA